MRRTAWEYGKLGLLIDDQPDATARVARELYGAEALPAWWKVARSIQCAYQALKAFQDVFARTDLGELRGLVVMDRYLPAVCGPGWRPVAWDFPPKDSENNEWHDRFAALVRSLLRAAESAREESHPGGARGPVARNFDMKFVTSYPYAWATQGEAEAESTGPRVPWKIRSIELLRQYRQEIDKKSDWKRLLRYGPEPDAPIVGHSRPPKVLFPDRNKLEASKWRARIWWPCIETLARFLQQRASDSSVPVVLFTGAGASLSQGPHGAGMPSTGELLKFAFRKVDNASKGRHEPDGRWPPPAAVSCLCNGAETLQKEKTPWDRRKPPITWLRERYKHGVEELDWRLEDLFNPKHHKKNLDQFRRFHCAFHDALYSCDHSYPYHHWLIARMPWTAILTTNFDGFHERAAAAAAQIPWVKDGRSRSLRLGSAVPAGPQVSRERVAEKLLEAVQGLVSETSRETVQSLIGELRAREQARQEAALFKPYGSLYSPGGEIALGPDEIKFFSRRFQDAFRGALKGEEPGALIIIGHSMRDNFIADVIQEMKDKLQDFQLLWVDPGSCLRSAEASQLRNPQRGKAENQESNQGAWEALMDHKRKHCVEILDKVTDQGVSWLKEQAKPSDFSGPIPATALEFLYDLWMIYQGEPSPMA